jgi:hypothetical protein
MKPRWRSGVQPSCRAFTGTGRNGMWRKATHWRSRSPEGWAPKGWNESLIDKDMLDERGCRKVFLAQAKMLL